MKTFALTLVAFGVASAVAACGGGTPPTIAVTASATTFTSGSTVTFSIAVTDFELRMPPDASGHSSHSKKLTAANEGHDHGHDKGDDYFTDGGHFHIYLDTTDTNPLRQGWHSQLEMPIRTSPGSHKLIFRLNDDNHRFFVPQITSTVDITVE